MDVVAGLVAVPASIYGIGWYLYVKFHILEPEFERMWPWALFLSAVPALLALTLLVPGLHHGSIIAGVLCIVATTVQIRIFNLTHVPYSADE